MNTRPITQRVLVTTAMAAMLLPQALAWAQDPAYNAPVSLLETDAAPAQLLARDLDRDGDLDIVVCGPDGLFWLENDTGAFTPRDFTVDNGALSGACDHVAAGHLGTPPDGELDLAFSGPDDAAVLLRNPDGTYTSERPFAAGRTDLTIGDVDSDGVMNVVAGNEVSTNRYDIVIYTLSQAGWTSEETGEFSRAFRNLHVVDLDRDGSAGIVATSLSSSVGMTYFHRNAFGDWSFRGNAASTERLELGDIDGDGDLDAVTIANGVLYRTQNTGRQFEDYRRTPIATEGSLGPAIEVGDLDRNGAPDVIYEDTETGTLHLTQLEPSTGSWRDLLLGPSAGSTTSIVALDVDHDSRPDLITATSNGIFMHLDVGFFHQMDVRRGDDLPITATAPRLLIPGDFDKDGDLDLITSDAQGTHLHTQRDGVWTSALISDSGNQNTGVPVDFDGDGDLDVIVSSARAVTFLENTGGAPWNTHPFFGSAGDVIYMIDVADIDQDGDPDILAGSRTRGYLVWGENLGTRSVTLHSIDSAWDNITDVAIADIDGDGAPDIVVSQVDNGVSEAAWYRNNRGPTSWTRHRLGSLNGTLHRVRAGDFDLDGQVELFILHGVAAWFDPGANPTDLWSSEAFQAQIYGTIPDTFVSPVADFDSDGYADVVSFITRNLSDTGETVAFLGPPEEGVFSAGLANITVDVFSGDEDLGMHHMVDIDGDGDLDWVVALTRENAIGVWEQYGFAAAVWELRHLTGDLGRVRSGVAYHTFKFDLRPLGQQTLEMMPRAFELSAIRGGEPLSGEDLAAQFDVRLYIDDNGTAGLQMESDTSALMTGEGTLQGTARYFFPEPIPAFGVASRERTPFFVVLTPAITLFEGPAEDLVLQWVPDSIELTAADRDTRAQTGEYEVPGPVSMRVGNTPITAPTLLVDVEMGTEATLRPLDVLIDPDGDPITVLGLYTTPFFGEIIQEGNTFIYQAEDHINAVDFFLYTVTDGLEETIAAAAVNIVGDLPPYANASTIEVREDTPITFVLDGGDSDSPYQFNLTALPLHGEATLEEGGNAPGLVTYTPDLNHVGTDSLRFTVTSESGTSEVATVTLITTSRDDDDDDEDGTIDRFDNCPSDPNPDQLDLDLDGLGDPCDPDDDGDLVDDVDDLCPRLPDPQQADNDRDGEGDLCDADDDNDTIPDRIDRCPRVADPDQADLDDDGLGDACDPDDDGDAIDDQVDNCLRIANRTQRDSDDDGLGDACDPDDDDDGTPDVDDVCPFLMDDQADADNDGRGDACDDDADSDGALLGDDCDDADPDLQTPLAFYADSDGDGYGDGSDPISVCAILPPEGFVEDNTDNCLDIANPDQLDSDDDGVGDACDDTGDDTGMMDAGDMDTDMMDADTVDADDTGTDSATDDTSADTGNDDLGMDDVVADAVLDTSEDSSGGGDTSGDAENDTGGDSSGPGPDITPPSDHEGGCACALAPSGPQRHHPLWLIGLPLVVAALFRLRRN